MHASGTVAGALDQLDQQTVTGDPSQADRVREFIRAELADFPERDGLGVTVHASGHHSDTSRNVSISIQPNNLTVDR